MTMLNNRFEIIEKIKDGGMGTVYKIYDAHLNSEFAAKVVDYDKVKQTGISLEDLVKSCENEARILTKLRHPGLPRIIDYSECKEGYCIVMDYIEGEDLDAVLKERLEERSVLFAGSQVISFGIQTLDILSYLHDNNILYLDLKPSNMMLKKDGKIVLVDFGIAQKLAKHVNTEMITNAQTRTQTIFGTPEYASPEHFNPDELDARSDIYSLGVTMAVLLTGEKPKMFCPPDILRSSNGEHTPADLVKIIEKAHNPDKRKRYSSAKEMREALKDLDGYKSPERDFAKSVEWLVKELSRKSEVKGGEKYWWEQEDFWYSDVKSDIHNFWYSDVKSDIQNSSDYVKAALIQISEFAKINDVKGVKKEINNLGNTLFWRGNGNNTEQLYSLALIDEWQGKLKNAIKNLYKASDLDVKRTYIYDALKRVNEKLNARKIKPTQKWNKDSPIANAYFYE